MKTLQAPSKKQFWFAVSLVVFGCALVTAGFIADPTGEVHSSVIGIFGEILAFAGACLGFDYYNHKTYLTITRRHALEEDEPEKPEQVEPESDNSNNDEQV